MKLRRLIFGIALSLVCLCGFAQPVASQTIDEQMTQLEDEIWHSLANLKQNSTSLIEELEDLRQLQAISQQTLTELQTCLGNTLDAYNDSAAQLQNTRISLQKKQQQVRKLSIVLAILIISFIGIRVVTIILRAKGLHLPELINILL